MHAWTSNDLPDSEAVFCSASVASHCCRLIALRQSRGPPTAYDGVFLVLAASLTRVPHCFRLKPGGQRFLASVIAFGRMATA